MKITLAIPVYQGISPETMRSLAPLLVTPGVRFGDWPRDGLIVRARSFLASRFLETDADVLLHIDADIRFNPADALAICEQAVTHDIVGGVYVGRRLRSGNLPTTLFKPGVPVTFDPAAKKADPVEVMFPAGGFMAFHRRVFERLAKRPDLPLCHQDDPRLTFQPFYLEYVWTDWNGVNVFLSEDWAICGRAREEGFTCYVNPSVRLGHNGAMEYRLEDAVPGLPPELRNTPQKITFLQEGERRLRITVGDPEPTEAPAAELPPGLSA